MTTIQIQTPPVSIMPKPSYGPKGSSSNSRATLTRTNAVERSRAGKMKTRIRILLVDDHPVVRKGIASCLARHAHLEILGEASDGQEALRKAKELSPDIILMDI